MLPQGAEAGLIERPECVLQIRSSTALRQPQQLVDRLRRFLDRLDDLMRGCDGQPTRTISARISRSRATWLWSY